MAAKTPRRCTRLLAEWKRKRKPLGVVGHMSLPLRLDMRPRRLVVTLSRPFHSTGSFRLQHLPVFSECDDFTSETDFQFALLHLAPSCFFGCGNFTEMACAQHAATRWLGTPTLRSPCADTWHFLWDWLFVANRISIDYPACAMRNSSKERHPPRLSCQRSSPATTAAPHLNAPEPPPWDFSKACRRSSPPTCSTCCVPWDTAMFFASPMPTFLPLKSPQRQPPVSASSSPPTYQSFSTPYAGSHPLPPTNHIPQENPKPVSACSHSTSSPTTLPVIWRLPLATPCLPRAARLWLTCRA